MNIAELLRKLADMVDQHSVPADAEKPVLSPPDQEPTPEPTFDKMVPPLQQKMELLKKVAGVPSEFDDKESDAVVVGTSDGCGDDDDEIAIMKRNAGLVAHEASEDNDITG